MSSASTADRCRFASYHAQADNRGVAGGAGAGGGAFGAPSPVSFASVAASYERLYRKPLVAEMRACMTFGSGASELCKLACAIVEGSPPYEA